MSITRLKVTPMNRNVASTEECKSNRAIEQTTTPIGTATILVFADDWRRANPTGQGLWLSIDPKCTETVRSRLYTCLSRSFQASEYSLL